MSDSTATPQGDEQKHEEDQKEKLSAEKVEVEVKDVEGGKHEALPPTTSSYLPPPVDRAVHPDRLGHATDRCAHAIHGGVTTTDDNLGKGGSRGMNWTKGVCSTNQRGRRTPRAPKETRTLSGCFSHFASFSSGPSGNSIPFDTH